MIAAAFRALTKLPHIITAIRLQGADREILMADMRLYLDTAYQGWNIDLNSNSGMTKALLRLLNRHTDFRNIFYFRLAQFGKGAALLSFLKWFCQPLDSLYMTAHPRMEVAPGGLLFHHPFSTIINAKKIGRGCIIRNNTTIGNTHENLDNSPVIGNNVNIGVGSIIIGKISIGDNVIIGAGSIVVKDVPSNCIVAGNPAKVIRQL